MTRQTFTLTVEPEQTDTNAATLLSHLTGQSKQHIKGAMEKGAVWLTRRERNQRLRRNNTDLQPGDLLTYHCAPDILAQPAPRLESIHLDAQFSIWLKPRGMTISGSRFGDHTSLKRCIETQHPSRPGVYIVHRLDRFTAGLIIVAHNKQTAAQLSELFRSHKISKQYHAWIQGKLLEPCTLTEPVDGKSAQSDVEPLTHHGELTLVKVQIHSGRKHQIRKHLSGIGKPIIGDRAYGTESAQDLQLSATSLAFELEDQRYEFHVDWQDLLLNPPQT